MRVKYESTPIKHLAIQCPECQNWFHSQDICNKTISYSYELDFMDCLFPKCGCDFKGKAVVEECCSPTVYKDTLEKKIEWR